MFGRGSVAASFVLIVVSNWARTPATIPQMLGRGSVAASFGLIIVSMGKNSSNYTTDVW